MEPDPPAGPRIDPLLQAGFVLPLLEQLRTWKDDARAGTRRLPLIGLNGPVGAGKSTLGRRLETLAPHFGLRLCVASIDDLYLSWPERGERLAGNPFGVTRVPPGSHDLALLLDVLARWRQGELLRLPRFDKTLASGQGDRAGWREQPCDALVLEGWLMGCRPLSPACLASVLEAACNGPLWSGDGTLQLRPEEWHWLPRWNRELENYLPLWEAFDGLWLLRPEHWRLPRRWRFQAEARQRRAGGGWLQPDDLERIVRASLCSLPPQLYQDPLSDSRGSEGAWMGMVATDANLCLTSGMGAQRSEAEMDGPQRLQPPIQAVAWLDGRRRCRSLWLQASLSPSCSATG